MSSESTDMRPQVAVVVAGHVDHGKSTLVGRLLVETGNIPQHKLEEIQQICNRQGRPLEYAYLLDALKDEQAQGITIERTRCFLRAPERDYLILDAPGHVEFIRNMVTGASRADAALLVIDALEGVQENSLRHGFLLSMLGISQIAVCVNKMDAVGYDPKVFEAVRDRYSAFLRSIGVVPAGFVPVSAREGGNVLKPCPHMPWHAGSTVFDMMRGFCLPPERSNRPFRMPVQDIYRHDVAGVEHRMVVGRIESGSIRPGEKVVFLPSGKEATVRTVERFQHPPLSSAYAGDSIGVTLEEQLYIVRGEIMARPGAMAPQVGSRLRADVLWLGRSPLKLGQTCLLKLGNMETPARVDSILRSLDPATLETSEGGDSVERHQVAECIVRLRRPMALDLHDIVPETGRFVLVDNYVIAGGGIVREVLPADRTTDFDGRAAMQKEKRCGGRIMLEERATSVIVVVSGIPRSGTSMMMQMMKAGGMSILTDSIRDADEDNPLGYHEMERVKHLGAGNDAWIGAAEGKAIKVVSPLLKHLSASHAFKVVFMERPLVEILASQAVMLKRRGLLKDAIPSDENMRVHLEAHLRMIKAWLSGAKHITVRYQNYHDMLTDTSTQAQAIASFLDLPLDVEAMVLAVRPELYRQRGAAVKSSTE